MTPAITTAAPATSGKYLAVPRSVRRCIGGQDRREAALQSLHPRVARQVVAHAPHRLFEQRLVSRVEGRFVRSVAHLCACAPDAFVDELSRGVEPGVGGVERAADGIGDLLHGQLLDS